MKLIDPNRTYPYVLEDDRGAEGAPVFQIKPLTYAESRKLTDQMTFNRDGEVRLEDKAEIKLQMFIEKVAKIENVVWPDGSGPPTVESDIDKRKLFSMLSISDGQEIIMAIQNLSRLEEDEAKN